MYFSRSAAVVAVAASLPLALAQTSTTCNPTEKTCSDDTGLDTATFSSDFTTGSSANASWSAATGTTITYGTQGAEFIIDKAGEAPTIQTDFYIFFGRIEVKMKAAAGTGIVSSIVLESDDLDEIDWEWLGGNTAQVETNFFGKGNTTSYDRAIYYSVSTPQDSFHTYTIDWTSERIEWIIDGTVVRTLPYSDALTLEGKNYPQTPMVLKMGNWCGGCSGEAAGTIEWAGGNTTFDNAPYTMYVESVAITNYNPGSKYEYSDETGDYDSITVINGTTTGSASASTASSTGSSSASSGSGKSSTGSDASTSAPTSSISVAGVDQQTAAAVSSTVTGSAYSTNTASASAQNTGSTIATSVVSATTQVPGSSPSSTTSGSSASSSGVVTQSGTSGATANTVVTGASLLTVALGFLML
ncbi:hypothetical protein LTR36_002744 [Oleoguttula mirabilis]|uniref:Crh-like protein n=1 Tax=Oleoguttula mirabilis TaxID=1507867 RepID=A0AAV9JK19_9PEZI|nr:hypothetical protein LTR36_002744 [Oleoguttula mirabilis]